MSSVKIQSNASGTGDLIIAAPNTNSTRTINLPDADGDFVTTGDSGTVSASMLASTLDLSGKTVTLPSGTGGKVLQVVSAVNGTLVSTSAQSYSATSITASITPSSTSSKILVLATVQSYLEATSSSTNADILGLALYRNSTSIFEPNSNYRTGVAASGVYPRIDYSLPIMKLDSPSSTSSTTYTFYFRSRDTQTVYINYNNGNSTITLMEIAA